MKVIGYVCCLLGLTCLTKAMNTEDMQDKLEQQLLDTLSTDEPPKIKRPFCNAFTGCGKKRSYNENSINSWDSLSQKDNIKLPVSLYKTLLRAVSQEIRDSVIRDNDDYRLPDIARDYDVYPMRKLTLRERHQS